MSSNSGGSVLGGLLAMGAVVCLAYGILIAIVAVVAAFVLVTVLLVAGVIGYLYAIVTADTGTEAGLLIGMPLIGLVSYLVVHEGFYDQFRVTLEADQMGAGGVILVISYFLGFIALIVGLCLTYMAATDGPDPLFCIPAGICLAWGGVSVATMMIAHDIAGRW